MIIQLQAPFSKAKVPNELNVAKVTVVFKYGDKNKFNNHSPSLVFNTSQSM